MVVDKQEGRHWWPDEIGLHHRLVALQTEEELERKAKKAATRLFWTQEEIDHIRRRAERLSRQLKWE